LTYSEDIYSVNEAIPVRENIHLFKTKDFSFLVRWIFKQKLNSVPKFYANSNLSTWGLFLVLQTSWCTWFFGGGEGLIYNTVVTISPVPVCTTFCHYNQSS